jgi:hypothetical protein
MLSKLVRLRPTAIALGLALVVTSLGPAVPEAGPRPVTVRAAEATKAVEGSSDFALASGTSHVAIHWTGHRDAHLTAAFSTDGSTFGEPQEVLVDEVGAGRNDGQTYGAVMVATGARVVRVTADERIGAVTVVGMDAGADVPADTGGGHVSALSPIPTIIPRSSWGADESIRYDILGDEWWTKAYYPLQKLTVHHTAGANNDPNPAATVRAIYHYHAVTQDWGDIGYNYLIDAAGRIYEGRHSRDYWNGATPTTDEGTGLIVESGHAYRHNPGNMGIALLGTYTSVAPKPAAVSALVRLLAWAVASNGIDPRGANTYVNPVTGRTRYTANITGHRDYESTGCPGGVLYGMMPSIRNQVAALRNLWPGEIYNPPRRVEFAAGTYVGRKFNAAGAITGSKSFTLSRASGAPTSQRATVPNQAGAWFYITAGVWAGYWVQESGATTLMPAPADPAIEPYVPTNRLNFAQGTHVGRKFNSVGGIIGTKTATLSRASSSYTTKKVQIPNQSGLWYYVTAGVWAGYWVKESAAVTLGAPPPEWAPIATFDPPARVWFAPGTYVGYMFNAYGSVSKTKSYTLTSTSSAPTIEYSPVPTRSGNWFYITAGIWGGYWVQESAGTTLVP